MKITWYGTASILLETAETSLLFDPFMKFLPKGQESEEIIRERTQAFRRQKNILITHGHLDHLSSVCSLFSDMPCTIYVTETPAGTLRSHGFPEEKIQRIHPGDILKFPKMTVRVYPGKHIRFDAAVIRQIITKKDTWKQFPRMIHLLRMNLRYRENGECLVYEIAAEEKHILLMGSAGLAEKISYPIDADALILPHQGRSDIDEYNYEIAMRLHPKMILLDHYDNTFPPVSMNVPVLDFCRNISCDIPAQALAEGITIEI